MQVRFVVASIAEGDWVLGRIPIDVVVGRRLEALRTARGVSQNELGFVLGTKGQHIAEFEAGTARIPPALIIQICQLFQVSVQSLFPTLDADSDPGLH
jgi:transcriptional regulator with XRE-family HTH domain